MLQWLSEAKSLLLSGAPGKKLPVPKTMPVPPPARKLPTAVDESTVWLVSYEQIRFPPELMIRRCPPEVYVWPSATPAVESPPVTTSVWPLL